MQGLRVRGISFADFVFFAANPSIPQIESNGNSHKERKRRVEFGRSCAKPITDHRLDSDTMGPNQVSCPSAEPLNFLSITIGIHYS